MYVFDSDDGLKKKEEASLALHFDVVFLSVSIPLKSLLRLHSTWLSGTENLSLFFS